VRTEHAGWIRAFDYVAATCFGATASLAAAFVVPEALPRPVGMLGGMVIGVLAVLPVLALLARLLAGLELVMIAAQIGMLAGMIGVMVGESLLQVAAVGAGVGIAVQLVLHVADRALHGEVRVR
jgi:hypothetical protein